MWKGTLVESQVQILKFNACVTCEKCLCICSYASEDDGRVGLYIASQPLTPENNYFEIEILDVGVMGAIGELHYYNPLSKFDLPRC